MNYKKKQFTFPLVVFVALLSACATPPAQLNEMSCSQMKVRLASAVKARQNINENAQNADRQSVWADAGFILGYSIVGGDPNLARAVVEQNQQIGEAITAQSLPKSQMLELAKRIKNECS